MKFNRTTLFFIAILLFPFFNSCDTAKQATRHYTKFIEKGGVVTCDTVTDTLTVTVKGKDGKDSLIYVPVDVNCPDVVLPETRYEVKWRYKHDLKSQRARDGFLIDSMQQVNKASRIERRVAKDNNKTKTKAARIENKSSVFWTWIGKRWWLLYILGLITAFLLRKFFNRFSLTLWNGKN